MVILGLKKHRISGSAEKRSVAAKKKAIQKQFRRKMGLNIDMPRDSGHGTTNDGYVQCPKSKQSFQNFILGFTYETHYLIQTLLQMLTLNLFHHKTAYLIILKALDFSFGIL